MDCKGPSFADNVQVLVLDCYSSNIQYKQTLIFHNRMTPWAWFVFEAGVTFLKTYEPVLYIFIDGS